MRMTSLAIAHRTAERAAERLLLFAVLSMQVGCAGPSSSNGSAALDAGAIRQVACERYGGVWRADGTCEIQSPGPGD